ncbi:hypothetical protein [Streptomonospora wellingtoniae]|uniref:Uncharacterized protein n=1 Tax=Streptomonospora wellingtoniae TaxID=3075544 RepID=A0ABU2KRQ8_9ACTN|nr:hypothetical protein [Streptomonospora sp. DSM 45055]MDT0301901.1 hypothetical protein [Streptomonospora sp. DSM 45055]
MEAIAAAAEAAGAATQWLLAPFARLGEPWLGGSSWGLAVLLVGTAWRLPLWPLLVREAAARVVRMRLLAAFAAEEEPPDRGTAAARVEAALRERGLRRPAEVAVGRAAAAVQIAAVLVVIVWSRTGEAAPSAAFAGLDGLAAPPVASWPGGALWALALCGAATASGIVTQRAVGAADERRRFFATRIAPVIFLGLGLFLPAATVVVFTAAMVLSLATALAAARTPAVRAPGPGGDGEPGGLGEPEQAQAPAGEGGTP